MKRDGIARYLSGRGDELVLLHGWGMNAEVWSPLLPALNRRFRVHRLDLPGHGASDASVCCADARDWAARLLAAAPEQAIWAGWSLGGTLALEAAALAPERVRALALVAATPRFVQADDWPCAMAQGQFSAFQAALRVDPDKALQRFQALQCQGDPAPRQLVRQLQGVCRHARPDADALARGLEILASEDLRSLLTRLGQPLQWLLGERDQLLPRCLADALAACSPRSRVTLLADACHLPFWSHRDQLVDALLELAARVDD
jgi:pimeloyl-[acyl-carrier protein] methyl ester esterase